MVITIKAKNAKDAVEQLIPVLLEEAENCFNDGVAAGKLNEKDRAEFVVWMAIERAREIYHSIRATEIETENENVYREC